MSSLVVQADVQSIIGCFVQFFVLVLLDLVRFEHYPSENETVTKEILSLSVLFNMGVQEVAYVYKKVAQKKHQHFMQTTFYRTRDWWIQPTGLSKAWKIAI